MIYSIKPLTSSPALEAFLLTEGNAHFLNRPVAQGSLAVFNGQRLVSVLPSYPYTGVLSLPDLFKVARELVIFQATSLLDKNALSQALRAVRGAYGKRILHLPFCCTGVKSLLEQTHPFVDMETFDDKEFLRTRRWLSRQQVNWKEFKFCYQRFDFKKDKAIAAFYLKHSAKRLKLTLAQVSAQMASLSSGGIVSHVAVLKHKRSVAAVCFVGTENGRDLVLVNNALNEEFLAQTPGNALLFLLLCHIKKHDLARRVHFRAIFPSTKPSYKLNWCEHSYQTFLQLVE